MSVLNNVFHKIPFFRLVLFFALGIFAYSKGLNFGYVYILLISGFLFLLLHTLILKQKDESRFVYKWFFGVATGAFMMAFGMMFSKQAKMFTFDGDSKCYVATVVSKPKECKDVVKCNVKLSEVNEYKAVAGVKYVDAVVYLPVSYESLNLNFGDSLMFFAEKGTLTIRNPELKLTTDKSMTLFVDDENWEVVSHSSVIGAESVRDSLISLLKKKDVLLMN